MVMYLTISSFIIFQIRIHLDKKEMHQVLAWSLPCCEWAPLCISLQQSALWIWQNPQYRQQPRSCSFHWIWPKMKLRVHSEMEQGFLMELIFLKDELKPLPDWTSSVPYNIFLYSFFLLFLSMLYFNEYMITNILLPSKRCFIFYSS